MGKKPKKLPITATPLPTTTKAEPTHANPHRRRKLSTTARINQFHALAKKLAQVRKAGGNLLEEQDLQLQIDALGGLHAYQRASLKGGDERSGRGACGKWLVGFLGPLKEELVQAGLSHQKKNKKSDADNESTPVIKLLDIGALNGETYSKQSKWIHAQYIDLNPQHANVIAQDFFLRPIPTVPADYFHVVCLSLVVNFVDDPERRGIMLMHARKFLLPKGLLFLVLPLPCTANSRYMNHERLKEICIAIGFEEIEFHATKRLSYHLWRRVEDSEFAPTNVDKKMSKPSLTETADTDCLLPQLISQASEASLLKETDQSLPNLSPADVPCLPKRKSLDKLMVDLLKCFTTGCTKSVRDAFTLPRLPNVLYRDEMWPVAAVLCVPQYCSMALFDKVYAHRLVDSAADTSVVERPEINNEERLKVIDDVESCRTQHDGYATNSTRKDAVQIDDDQKFIEFEDIERWWKELTETHHDDYAIVFDIIKKCSKQDFLSPRDFEPILDEVTQRHPALEFLSSLRVFQDRYAETVITRIFYSKINNCNERMTLAEFRKQAVLEILIQLQLDDDINSTHHVFSYKHFYVIYCTFWELDTDHNMIVEASDMFRYGGGALTDMMMKRVVGGYGKPLALGTASKQLTYKDYIWFMLCVEDKRTVASIEYWFRCLDADGDGVLKFAELREFYDQQVNKMIDYGIREPFKRDEFDCQVVNLIKPESPEYLTLSDLLRTPENAAILFDILFDATNYNTRIRRMDPEFREKEEVWIEEEVGSVDGGGGGDVCLKRVKLEGWNKFAERMYETLADKEAGGGDGGGSTGAVDAGPRSLRRLEDDEDDMRGNYLNRGEFDSEEDDGWG